jgi:hypothetical protein
VAGSEPGVSILHTRSISTEVYLCRPCSCHAIEDGNAGRAGVAEVAGVPLWAATCLLWMDGCVSPPEVAAAADGDDVPV